MQYVMMMLAMLWALGCDPSGTTGTGGGGGTTAAQGGGGEGGATTIGTTSAPGVTTTTSTNPPACGTPEPPGCSYEDAWAGFSAADAQVGGGLLPAPGDAAGALASCMRPLPSGLTLTRAVFGFTGEPPAELPIAAWTQDGSDPGQHDPTAAVAMLETTEAGPDGLTLGVYLLASSLAGEGLTPCVGARLSDYLPASLTPSDGCYQPARTWWLGLPADPAGPSGLTWAMLDCPKSPQILPYRVEYPLGLRP
jgi:hypothetical protein